MQIKEFGKNRTNIRDIGDAVGRAKAKGQGETASKNDRGRINDESFQDSLQKSMNMERTAENSVSESNRDSEWRPENTARLGGGVISHKEADFGKNKTRSAGIQVEQNGEIYSAKEVEVRGISYGECDKVEINVLEGYTLKAKLDAKGEGINAEGCRIYVEMKDEEGTIKACLFEGAGLHRESESVMEKIAYAVMHEREEV